MPIKYSYDNVEAMINSINSNSELINSMVKKSIENDKLIYEKMNFHANSKKLFSNTQIDMYTDYILESNNMKFNLESYQKEIKSIGGITLISSEICKEESSCESMFNIFSKINKLQISIMEKLCGIIGKSNMLIGAI